jgi:hypothetical protein
VAEALAVGATHLVAETVDRLIRPYGYHSQTNPHAVPSLKDMIELRSTTSGLTLVSVAPPDSSPKQGRKLN